jgi:hypothetical protein
MLAGRGRYVIRYDNRDEASYGYQFRIFHDLTVYLATTRRP